MFVSPWAEDTVKNEEEAVTCGSTKMRFCGGASVEKIVDYFRDLSNKFPF